MNIMDSDTPSDMILILPHELRLLIFSYVPARDLLLSLSLVSRKCRELIQDEFFWCSSKLMMHSQSTDTYKKLSLHQLQRFCSIIEFWKNYDKWKIDSSQQDIPKIFRPVSVLLSHEDARNLREEKNYEVCIASSTHRKISEHIENVLLRNYESTCLLRENFYLYQDDYWSSEPNESGKPGQSDENLLFTTQCPDTLINQINVKPFTELCYDHGKTYSWKELQYSVYRLPVGIDGGLNNKNQQNSDRSGYPCFISKSSYNSDFKNMKDDEKIDKLLKNHKPVYTSPLFKIKNLTSDSWQTYRLPMGIIGNVIKIELLGKNIRQYENSGYYSCVKRIVINGFPLHRSPTQESYVL